MFDKFKPDYTFNSYDEITPEFLRSEGVFALLIDIDNTLAPYEQPTPDQKLISWFSSLSQNGIKCALISNNNSQRVDLFNKDLGLVAFANSNKPSKKTVLSAVKILGVDRERCAVLGDQLFTDAYAGKRLGIRAIIVPPIKDKKTLFFRIKRALEKPIMKSYRKDLEEQSQKKS